MRPEFFLGTLDQAIKIACFKPAKDVRTVVLLFNIKLLAHKLFNYIYYFYTFIVN